MNVDESGAARPDSDLKRLLDKVDAADAWYKQAVAKFEAAAAKWEANLGTPNADAFKVLMDEAKAVMRKAEQYLDEANAAVYKKDEVAAQLASSLGAVSLGPPQHWCPRIEQLLGPYNGVCQWRFAGNVTRFVNELRGASPTECEYEGSAVTCYPLDTSLRSSEANKAALLVRPRVKKLWALVRETADRFVAGGERVVCISVTGNPGIGKTRSMDELQRTFLAEGVSYFYDVRKDGVVHAMVAGRDHGISGVGGFLVYSSRSFEASETMMATTDRVPYYLYDPDLKADSNALPKGAGLGYRLVIASSPNPRHTHGWYKDSAWCELVSPPWTLDELLAVRQVCWPAVSEQTVRVRYLKYGGVIRAVFGARGVVDKYERTIAENLCSLDASYMHQLLAGDLGGVETQSKHVCSGMHIITPDNDEFLPAASTCTLSSVFTAARLACKFWKAVHRDGRNNDARFTSYFERLCMVALSRGGKFPCRNLTSLETGFLTLPESTLSPVPREAAADGAAGADGKEDDAEPSPTHMRAFYSAWAAGAPEEGARMIAPSVTNLPVVDFADRPYRGYQATVSSSHSISYRCCKELLDELDRVHRVRFPDALDADLPKLQLYFVVPEHVAPGFSKQQFKGPPKPNPLLDRVEQYVIGLGAGAVASFVRLFDESVATEAQWVQALSELEGRDRDERSWPGKRRRLIKD